MPSNGNSRTADAPDRSFANAARLKTIGLLVKHPDISLLVLNAPENAMGGFTPLGYAVRLNAHDIVQVLLDSGAGAISVNGMDAHRATPLMCKSIFFNIVRVGTGYFIQSHNGWKDCFEKPRSHSA